MKETETLPPPEILTKLQTKEERERLVLSRLKEGIEEHRYAEQPLDPDLLKAFSTKDNPLSAEHLEVPGDKPKKFISLTLGELKKIGRFFCTAKVEDDIGIACITPDNYRGESDDYHIIILPDYIPTKEEVKIGKSVDNFLTRVFQTMVKEELTKATLRSSLQ